ncbi:hypothetical protein D9M70_531190 [compost metagenome]
MWAGDLSVLEPGQPDLAGEEIGKGPYLRQQQSIGWIDDIDAALSKFVLRQDPHELALGEQRVGDEGWQGADTDAGLDHLTQHQAVVDDEACRQFDARRAVGTFHDPASRLVGEPVAEAIVILELAHACRRTPGRQIGGRGADDLFDLAEPLGNQ